METEDVLTPSVEATELPVAEEVLGLAESSAEL